MATNFINGISWFTSLTFNITYRDGSSETLELPAPNGRGAIEFSEVYSGSPLFRDFNNRLRKGSRFKRARFVINYSSSRISKNKLLASDFIEVTFNGVNPPFSNTLFRFEENSVRKHWLESSPRTQDGSSFEENNPIPDGSDSFEFLSVNLVDAIEEQNIVVSEQMEIDILFIGGGGSGGSGNDPDGPSGQRVGGGGGSGGILKGLFVINEGTYFYKLGYGGVAKYIDSWTDGGDTSLYNEEETTEITAFGGGKGGGGSEGSHTGSNGGSGGGGGNRSGSTSAGSGGNRLSILQGSDGQSAGGTTADTMFGGRGGGSASRNIPDIETHNAFFGERFDHYLGGYVSQNYGFNGWFASGGGGASYRRQSQFSRSAPGGGNGSYVFPFTAGNGGEGIDFSHIFGKEYGDFGWFCGGGAGGGRDVLEEAWGTYTGRGGIGGGGGSDLSNNGVDGTGGGGAGADSNQTNGGTGGSGIVLVKYGDTGIIEEFTSNDTWDWNAAGQPSTVSVLVVAGGGGGGGGNVANDGGGAGGGGAGGYIFEEYYSVAGNISVTVGSGGSGGTDDGSQGQNGGDSSFGDLTAIGGGGGGGFTTRDGLSGGSGGGSSGTGSVPGSPTIGQGNTGGLGFAAIPDLDTETRSQGGGGGGAFSSGTSKIDTISRTNGDDAQPNCGSGGGGARTSLGVGGSGSAGFMMFGVLLEDMINISVPSVKYTDTFITNGRRYFVMSKEDDDSETLGLISSIYGDFYEDDDFEYYVYNDPDETGYFFAVYNKPIEASIIVVAGGGGGGARQGGGGGGAGGVLFNESYTIIPNGRMAISVGSGGDGKDNSSAGQGEDGGNTIFGDLTAIGGGGGGARIVSSGTYNGRNGGCGGGAGSSTDNFAFGGVGSQGGDGGDSDIGGDGASGGGGFSEDGDNGGNGISANGGDGINVSTIFGTSVGDNGIFAGGGGGGDADGLGGSGGGGNGSGFNQLNGSNAVANTGGGGGGGGRSEELHGSDENGSGGNGGSGIVIIKIPKNQISN